MARFIKRVIQFFGHRYVAEASNNLGIGCGPELLEHTEGAQRLGSRLFKPMLPIQSPSLLIHHER